MKKNLSFAGSRGWPGHDMSAGRSSWKGGRGGAVVSFVSKHFVRNSPPNMEESKISILMIFWWYHLHPFRGWNHCLPFHVLMFFSWKIAQMLETGLPHIFQLLMPEIPNNQPPFGWCWNPINNGISTTNLNWWVYRISKPSTEGPPGLPLNSYRRNPRWIFLIALRFDSDTWRRCIERYGMDFSPRWMDSNVDTRDSWN